jgi:hypothetical protein
VWKRGCADTSADTRSAIEAKAHEPPRLLWPHASARNFFIDRPRFYAYSPPRPAHRGRLRRRARVGAGCGVPRAWPCNQSPGRPRATPPSRHYERDLRTQTVRPADTAALGNVRRHLQAGSRPINRRGGAPKGERPPAAQPAKAICAGTRGPALVARSQGCLASALRLSALRPLTFLVRGTWQASEAMSLAGTMMLGSDDVGPGFGRIPDKHLAVPELNRLAAQNTNTRAPIRDTSAPQERPMAPSSLTQLPTETYLSVHPVSLLQ